MPNYREHLYGGHISFAITLLLVVPHYNPTILTSAEWFFFTLAGALFPDIDIKSKGQRYFYWFLFVLLIILAITKKYVTLSIVSVLAMVPMLCKHRGLFHRTWFIVGTPCLLWYFITISYPALSQALFLDMLFFTMGALSHLYLDLGWRKMLQI